MTRRRKIKITPLPEGDRKCISQLRRFLQVATAVFDEGKQLKAKHIQMLVEQGLREDGDPVQSRFRIEDWESMEVRPFSNPQRKGHGMIYDTVSNMHLTPKGRAAFERLKAFGVEVQSEDL